MTNFGSKSRKNEVPTFIFAEKRVKRQNFLRFSTKNYHIFLLQS